jgi:hypothetical protein
MKKEIKLNEYVEFFFNLTLELIALFDFGGDLILLRSLYLSTHTSWFSFSLLTMLAPFFICYVPLLTFQKRKIDQANTSWIDSISTFAYLTPLVLIYLQVMDIVYIINSVVLVPIAFIF